LVFYTDLRSTWNCCRAVNRNPELAQQEEEHHRIFIDSAFAAHRGCKLNRWQLVNLGSFRYLENGP